MNRTRTPPAGGAVATFLLPFTVLKQPRRGVVFTNDGLRCRDFSLTVYGFETFLANNENAIKFRLSRDFSLTVYGFETISQL